VTVCLAIRFEECIALSPAGRKAVEDLIADCSAYDGFDPCVHFDTHLNADPKFAAWRLAWAEAPDDINAGRLPACSRDLLAGAARVFAPGRQEGEISACVAPVFRRQGIFKQLYGGLAADLVAAGIQSVLLVCESRSPSSAAIASTLGATLDRSEYRMSIGREGLAEINAPASLRLVPVSGEEIEEAAELAAVIFDDRLEDARAFAVAELSDKEREQYIARAAEGPVGMASLACEEGVYWIHGLGVVPALRNRGFGGSILDAMLVVLARRGADSVKLEVDIGNFTAIALYRSRGFEDENRTDYWRPGVQAG
jgi:ribosomal protein S18 acetylase RimI-like enzyme